MADPLKLLREYALEGKPIREQDDLIIFGDLAFHRKEKTNFKIYGSAAPFIRPADVIAHRTSSTHCMMGLFLSETHSRRSVAGYQWRMKEVSEIKD